MQPKTIMVEMLSLSADKLSEHRLRQTAEFRWREVFFKKLVSASSTQFKHGFGLQHVVAMWSFPKFNQISPGPQQPGFFMATTWPLTPAMKTVKLERRRKPVENDTTHLNDPAQFHDSELDIYDLFNVCNGIVREGFLDVKQLDNYTAAEAKELNIDRLREIWKHTKTGCPDCRKVVEALQQLRRTVGHVADEIRSQDGPDTDTDPDINHISSIS